ncbi:MAG TPA: hypothetical protein DEA22_09055, partial [Blastocatellia bacterium]|nr:hypothetical protein [Blastocatellia bacterium]
MRIFVKQFRPQIAIPAFVLALFLLNAKSSTSQPPAEKDQSGETTVQKGDDPNILRWKIFLDSLRQEAKTVFPDDRRPYAMVDVANAYWEIDHDLSRSTYVSALDAAVSLTKRDKKYQPLINYVLSAATRRDASLAKTLNKRLLDDTDPKDRDNISSVAALDLLEANPEAAARLAEAFAPNGLQDGTAAFLIFGLAKKDIRLSNRVYNTYLTRVSTNENIPLEQILLLAGYSFGYAEYYSVDGRGNLSGASFLPIEKFSAYPAFSASFLELAFRRISMSIERRDKAVGAEIEALNFPILFALEYLIPEVAKFSPNTLLAWQQLQQQGIAGTSVPQNKQVQKHLQHINRARVSTREFNDPSQTPEQKAEASLEDVEKLPGTCQRDVIYSKAALSFSSRKNSKRALEIAGKIKDLKQSEAVKEMIFINMAESEIENGDFDAAQKKAEKISAPEQKAILYVMLAQAMVRKNDDPQTSMVAVDDGIRLAEKLSDAKYRAGFLFSLATLLLKIDLPEAQSLLRSAIKDLNKQESTDQMSFSIPMKVPLSCQGDDSWYGGF